MKTNSIDFARQRATFVAFLERDKTATQEIVAELEPIFKHITPKLFASMELSHHDREDYEHQVWQKLCEVTPAAFEAAGAPLYTFVKFKMLEARREFFKNKGVREDRSSTRQRNFSGDVPIAPEALEDELVDISFDQIELRAEVNSILAKANPSLLTVLVPVAFEGASISEAANDAGYERTAFYRELRAFKEALMAAPA